MKQRCILFLGILLLAGCGQKGPLYLPKAEAEKAPEGQETQPLEATRKAVAE